MCPKHVKTNLTVIQQNRSKSHGFEESFRWSKLTERDAWLVHPPSSSTLSPSTSGVLSPADMHRLQNFIRPITDHFSGQTAAAEISPESHGGLSVQRYSQSLLGTSLPCNSFHYTFQISPPLPSPGFQPVQHTPSFRSRHPSSLIFVRLAPPQPTLGTQWLEYALIFSARWGTQTPSLL